MILYDYFRSSAGYRVRIALALKRLHVERLPVHLLRGGGEQRQDAYLVKNPQGLAPTLQLDDGRTLTQSLAIVEYLDAVHPQPRLVPEDPFLAAKVRAVALAVACEIHPLCNLRVIKYLAAELQLPEDGAQRWRLHWMSDGLSAIEQLIEGGPFCFGDRPTLADVCLIPQLYNARRFGAPLDHLRKSLAVEAACALLPAFQAAHPSVQSDAE